MYGYGAGLYSSQRKGLLDQALSGIQGNADMDLREKLNAQGKAETEAMNDEWMATASPTAIANGARTPGGRLYSLEDSPFGASQVPTTMADDMNANAFGVNGANQYAKMWNYARDRMNAAGGKGRIKDERQTFGTAEPMLRGLQRARGGVYT
jgi:hypothetical protein